MLYNNALVGSIDLTPRAVNYQPPMMAPSLAKLQTAMIISMKSSELFKYISIATGTNILSKQFD